MLEKCRTTKTSRTSSASGAVTYMYTKAPVTYPFGYGLGYAEFMYSNFAAPDSASKAGKFNVAVEITNEGALTSMPRIWRSGT